MRTFLCTAGLLLLSLAACDGDAPPKEAEAFCDDLAASNEGCWNDGLDAQCLELFDACETEIVVLESCPVQLDCMQ